MSVTHPKAIINKLLHMCCTFAMYYVVHFEELIVLKLKRDKNIEWLIEFRTNFKKSLLVWQVILEKNFKLFNFCKKFLRH